MKKYYVGATRCGNEHATVSIQFTKCEDKVIEKVYLADLSGHVISNDPLKQKLWHRNTDCQQALAKEMLNWSNRRLTV